MNFLSEDNRQVSIITTNPNNNDNNGNKNENLNKLSKSEALASMQTWTHTPRLGEATNFHNCTEKAISNTEINYNKYTNNNSTLNIDTFSSWYSLFESMFDCVGFCDTVYSTEKNINIQMSKYLFTNINRGPPVYKGCLRSITEWAPERLRIYGAGSLAFVVVEIFLIVLVFSLVCSKKEK